MQSMRNEEFQALRAKIATLDPTGPEAKLLEEAYVLRHLNQWHTEQVAYYRQLLRDEGIRTLQGTIAALETEVELLKRQRGLLPQYGDREPDSAYSLEEALVVLALEVERDRRCQDYDRADVAALDAVIESKVVTMMEAMSIVTDEVPKLVRHLAEAEARIAELEKRPDPDWEPPLFMPIYPSVKVQRKPKLIALPLHEYIESKGRCVECLCYCDPCGCKRVGEHCVHCPC